jgi:hypothetical protein
MSPTSSEKIVPRSASSNFPICFLGGAVNAPALVRKAPTSISSSGIAAQLTLHEPLLERRLLRWMAPRISSFAHAL